MKKILRDWWWVILILLGVVLLGVVLRLYRLTILPVFADEAIYIRWAQVMKAEPSLRFLPLSDGKQPLFMWTVIPFLKLFSDPLVAGRAVSVATGFGTLTGIFAVSYLLFKSKKAALGASLIYAISPFSVFFDRMALADSMLSMFGIWTFFFGIVTAKTLRLDSAILTGFVLGGALLTKSPALFFTLLLPSVWLFSPWPKAIKIKMLHLIKLAGLLAVSYLIGYGMYNILRLGPNFNMIGARNADYVFPINHLWTNPKDPFIFLIDRSFEWIKMMGPWPVLVLGLIGLLANWKKHWKELSVITSWFIVPILIQSEFAKVFTARYIFFSVPYLFIVAGLIFLLKIKYSDLIAAGLVVVFGFSAFPFNYYLLTNPQKASLPRSERSGYLEEWTAGQGIKEIADYIRGEYLKNPNKKIVAGTEGYFGTLPDGLQMYLNNRPEITVIGIGLDFAKLPTSLSEAEKAGDVTYLVVNKSRFNGKAEKLGLKLIGAFPKAMRPEGTHEFVVYGPQDELLFFQVTKP